MIEEVKMKYFSSNNITYLKITGVTMWEKYASIKLSKNQYEKITLFYIELF